MTAGPVATLPRLEGVRHPPTALLTSLRPAARWLVRRRFAVTVRHANRVPRSGATILAANHVGVVDGPLLAIFSPRPVHALTKQEMFAGRLGGLLRRSGQIPLDRAHPDPAAIKTCLRVLADGGVVGIFPEGTRGAGDLGSFRRGAAYLGLVTGAAVVPVTFLGTREPGAGRNALPPRGGDVEIVFGAPYRLPAVAWPRTREQVRRSSLLLREHMLACIAEAVALTGRDLPGPLPPGQAEDDPDEDVVPD